MFAFTCRLVCLWFGKEQERDGQDRRRVAEDKDALQKRNVPLSLFIFPLNAFYLHLQAKATHDLMFGYGNTVMGYNEIFTFGASCTGKNVLVFRKL